MRTNLRRGAAATLIALLLAAVPSAALAAKPAAATYDQLAARLQASANPQATYDAMSNADKATLQAPEGVSKATVVGSQSGQLATSTGSTSLLAAAVTKCYYAYWIAQAVNVTNTVLFQYKEQVNWCSDGTKITSLYRFTDPITPRPWIWQFQGETLFDISYNSTHSTATAGARGTFNQLLPPLGIVVGQSHPYVEITVRANGTASGSISW